MNHSVKYVLSEIKRCLTFRFLYRTCYFIFSRRRIKKNKIIFCEVRFSYLTDNFIRLYDSLKKNTCYEVKIHYLNEVDQGKWRYLRNNLKLIRDMATAGCVFVNDACKAIGCIKMRPETKVIQTWHACGAFKKFGMSIGEKKFGETTEILKRYPNYGNLNCVTVSSKEVIWAYEEAMSLQDKPGIVQPMGVSRTDAFYDPEVINNARKKLKHIFPESIGKKVILYAPTFRGKVSTAYSPSDMDIDLLQQEFQGEYVLLVKHHPFVKNREAISDTQKSFAKDVTEVMSIEELICVSDLCISDYSSLIFEYSLFERPMIFFAPDLEDYFDWRGFYYSYEDMTPGPVVRTTEEIVASIKAIADNFNVETIRQFREKFMGACDGHATERILAFALEG